MVKITKIHVNISQIDLQHKHIDIEYIALLHWSSCKYFANRFAKCVYKLHFNNCINAIMQYLYFILLILVL